MKINMPTLYSSAVPSIRYFVQYSFLWLKLTVLTENNHKTKFVSINCRTV